MVLLQIIQNNCLVHPSHWLRTCEPELEERNVYTGELPRVI
jgi:hypothetical protein